MGSRDVRRLGRVLGSAFGAGCGILFVGLVLSACGSGSEPRGEPLRVLAAASLTDVVGALAAAYDEPVATSFGGSSALARQVRDGAPADVFLSASPQWIDYLREVDALAGEPIVLARNRLVAVAPRDGALAAAGVVDPQSLVDALAPDARVAIADEGVPAGEYARAALESTGLLAAFRPHLVGQSDVRAVLHAVEQSELAAGFVYATDAAVADVVVLFGFEAGRHPEIEYQAAALRGARQPDAARAFLDFLEGDTARGILSEASFQVP